MKFKVTFKSPDSVHDTLRDAARQQVAQMPDVLDDDIPDMEDSKFSELAEAIGKWVKYAEYITVEFDTDAGTATVVERA